MTEYSTYSDFLQCAEDVWKALCNCNSCKLIMCNTCAYDGARIYLGWIVFNYTWSDQTYHIPVTACYKLEAYWAWAKYTCWWYSCWYRCLSAWDWVSVVVWQHWWDYWASATYWFWWKWYCPCTAWWWLTWFFTWCDTVWPNDASRAIMIAWWAGWNRCDCSTWDSSWWWLCWQNWRDCYWCWWSWWTQTWHWSQWYASTCQFKWWEGPWWANQWWGWWWWWGNASYDCTRATWWWGSWYIWWVDNWTTSVNWRAAWADWCATLSISY